jgi:hypothetical protein
MVLNKSKKNPYDQKSAVLIAFGTRISEAETLEINNGDVGI